MKNAVFCRLVQQELNVSYETSMFRLMFMFIDIDKNNYPEETELDTNPSSNPNPIHWWAYCWPFHVQSCYDTTIFNYVYMNSPKNLWRDP